MTEPAIEVTGHDQPMFGFADWYNRIHLSEYAVDLGNVVDDQVKPIVFWNAYLVPRVLNSFTGINDEGFTVTHPGVLPFTFEGLRERTYNFNISTDGPGEIDAEYMLVFDSMSLLLPFVGQRITAWVWRPDWSTPIIERMEWKTDVLTAYDGTEQRIKLRAFPRRSLEFDFTAEGHLRRKLDSALWGWGSRQWALPVWPDGEQLSASLSIGATSVPATTDTRDYVAGGLVMLLDESGNSETIEIEEVQASALTLARPTINAWEAGKTMVFPVRIARLPASHGIRRFTGDVVYGRMQFSMVDDSGWPAAVETMYRGAPVLLTVPNWIEDIGLDYARKLAEIDYGTGPRAFNDESGFPEMIQTHRWLLDGRESISEFKSWLYSRAGKYGALWVPTWAHDIIVVANIGAAAVNIDIENIDYHVRIAAGTGRQDIRIQLASGQVFYRRITGSEVIDDDIERLTIDAALGVLVTPADVVMVSFMALSRLDTDGVEITYAGGDLAEAAHPMRAIKHDL